MSVNVVLDLSEHILSLNELSKDGLVAIEEGSGIESNHELVAVAGGTFGSSGQDSSLVVAHVEITIGVPDTVGTVVLFVGAASDKAETSHTLVDGFADVGAESVLEVAGSDGLSVLVEFENEITELVGTGGNCEEDSGVGSVAVVVEDKR